jgi:hypothetical protein
MRRQSFSVLWPLFSKATKPAKELSESFSALAHLRPLLALVGQSRVLHIGDGAHARTAALFAVKTAAENISVDPVINEALVSAWRDEFGIERFAWRKSRLDSQAAGLNALSRVPVFVTFVHAHVDVDRELESLRWDAAFTLACCSPGSQLTRTLDVHEQGRDGHVLSEDRTFQVLINPVSAYASSLRHAVPPR